MARSPVGRVSGSDALCYVPQFPELLGRSKGVGEYEIDRNRMGDWPWLFCSVHPAQRPQYSTSALHR